MKVILVPGTWATHRDDLSGEWFSPQSRFVAMLGANGFDLVHPERPFEWCCSVDGIGAGDHADWQAAGANLYAYVVPPVCPEKRIPGPDTRIVAHSHGGAAVAYACAMGLRVRSLITVGTPVRGDMAAVWAKARPNIGVWLHLYSDWDWKQLAGSLLDGQIGIYRKQPLADYSHLVPGVGHSRVLHDVRYLPWWRGNGWLRWLAYPLWETA